MKIRRSIIDQIEEQERKAILVIAKAIKKVQDKEEQEQLENERRWGE